MTGLDNSMDKQTTWLENVLNRNIRLDAEIILFGLILLLAVFTRFYDLESRVMSHDENTHVYFSWTLEQGQGYAHDPLSHGPLQFHMVAFSYFLFGDSDASARVPAALSGVMGIAMIWLLRKWLGKKGTLVAALLMLISPYMLYYARYVRNDVLIVPQALLLFWAVFRYFETHKEKWLYLVVLATTLHITTKETAYIYLAGLLVFLALHLAWRLYRQSWSSEMNRWLFFGGFASGTIGGAATGAIFLRTLETEAGSLATGGLPPVIILSGVLVVLGVVLALVGLIREYGKRLRTDFPALDLIVVLLTLILPQLTALAATVLGWDPLAYDIPEAFNKTVIALIVLGVIGMLAGFIWDWRRWLICAGVFYVPFIVLYTTFFTNGTGFASGMVGSLGYWLVQQSVERGSQPVFYYYLLQIPMYEFLPALGVLIAALVGWRKSRTRSPVAETTETTTVFPAIPFLAYWTIFSVAIFSYASERMPWLTVHLALPMILLAGWGIGAFLDMVNWERWRTRGWMLAGLITLGTFSFVKAMGWLLGPEPPFAGDTLAQLNATASFLSALVISVISIVVLLRMSRGWYWSDYAQAVGVLMLGLLAFVTARSAFRAAYINYDYATEFLVYAHSAPGPKIALAQIEDLSERIHGDLSIEVAYDNETLYPYWWYLRNYPNAHYYGPSPNRELLNKPIVVAGDKNWPKIDPLLGDQFYSFTYNRIWWPNQDYFRLGWEHIERERNGELAEQYGEEVPPMGYGEYLTRFWARLKPYLFEREARNAAWQIWFNRDYEAYGVLTGKAMTSDEWNPSSQMKIYIRKDIAALIWDFGAVPADFSYEEYIDPYAGKIQSIAAEIVLGYEGSGPGQFLEPRGLAVAADGSIYVADSDNHRIQHLSPEGEVLHMWGYYDAGEGGSLTDGAFNEPWGVAVAPDGSVYVADTWNHRIQHFSAEGEFLDTFGFFGQAETAFAMWGPRDVAVDDSGRVYVSDTGNKRILVFSDSGEAIMELGGFGLTPGFLDEPVGLALDSEGRLYVSDTWNQRIQVFTETSGTFLAQLELPVDGWYGMSLENKPYLDVSSNGQICTTDPEGYRILCFNDEGTFLLGWGSYGMTDNSFGLASGISFDQDCGVWVSDSANHRIMKFALDICY